MQVIHKEDMLEDVLCYLGRVIWYLGKHNVFIHARHYLVYDKQRTHMICDGYPILPGMCVTVNGYIL